MAEKKHPTMKKISLICCMLTLAFFAVSAQKNPSIKELEGSWNMYAMHIPGMMYYNSITDSLSMDMKAMGMGDQVNADSATKAMLTDIMKMSMKKEFEKMYFKMDASGVMFESSPTSDKVTIMGKYDPEAGYITLQDPKEGDDGKLQVRLENGLLYLLKQEAEVTVTMSCKPKKD